MLGIRLLVLINMYPKRNPNRDAYITCAVVTIKSKPNNNPEKQKKIVELLKENMDMETVIRYIG